MNSFDKYSKFNDESIVDGESPLKIQYESLVQELQKLKKEKKVLQSYSRKRKLEITPSKSARQRTRSPFSNDDLMSEETPRHKKISGNSSKKKKISKFDSLIDMYKYLCDTEIRLRDMIQSIYNAESENQLTILQMHLEISRWKRENPKTKPGLSIEATETQMKQLQKKVWEPRYDRVVKKLISTCHKRENLERKCLKDSDSIGISSERMQLLQQTIFQQMERHSLIVRNKVLMYKTIQENAIQKQRQFLLEDSLGSLSSAYLLFNKKRIHQKIHGDSSFEEIISSSQDLCESTINLSKNIPDFKIKHTHLKLGKHPIENHIENHLENHLENHINQNNIHSINHSMDNLKDDLLTSQIRRKNEFENSENFSPYSQNENMHQGPLSDGSTSFVSESSDAFSPSIKSISSLHLLNSRISAHNQKEEQSGQESWFSGLEESKDQLFEKDSKDSRDFTEQIDNIKDSSDFSPQLFSSRNNSKNVDIVYEKPQKEKYIYSSKSLSRSTDKYNSHENKPPLVSVSLDEMVISDTQSLENNILENHDDTYSTNTKSIAIQRLQDLQNDIQSSKMNQQNEDLQQINLGMEVDIDGLSKRDRFRLAKQLKSRSMANINSELENVNNIDHQMQISSSPPKNYIEEIPLYNESLLSKKPMDENEAMETHYYERTSNRSPRSTPSDDILQNTDSLLKDVKSFLSSYETPNKKITVSHEYLEKEEELPDTKTRFSKLFPKSFETVTLLDQSRSRASSNSSSLSGNYSSSSVVTSSSDLNSPRNQFSINRPHGSSKNLSSNSNHSRQDKQDDRETMMQIKQAPRFASKDYNLDKVSQVKVSIPKLNLNALKLIKSKETYNSQKTSNSNSISNSTSSARSGSVSGENLSARSISKSPEQYSSRSIDRQSSHSKDKLIYNNNSSLSISSKKEPVLNDSSDYLKDKRLDSNIKKKLESKYNTIDLRSISRDGSFSARVGSFSEKESEYLGSLSARYSPSTSGQLTSQSSSKYLRSGSGSLSSRDHIKRETQDDEIKSISEQTYRTIASLKSNSSKSPYSSNSNRYSSNLDSKHQYDRIDTFKTYDGHPFENEDISNQKSHPYFSFNSQHLVRGDSYVNIRKNPTFIENMKQYKSSTNLKDAKLTRTDSTKDDQWFENKMHELKSLQMRLQLNPS